MDSTHRHSIPPESTEAIRAEKSLISETENLQNPIEIKSILNSDYFVYPTDGKHLVHEMPSSLPDIDFRDCEASVSERNLKMYFGLCRTKCLLRMPSHFSQSKSFLYPCG